MSPEYCPHCGAEVPPNARACRECGSDEQTGWSDRAHTERLGIPDDEFDYDKFIEEEFAQKGESRIKPRDMVWLWWALAVLLLILLVWFSITGGL